MKRWRIQHDGDETPVIREGDGRIVLRFARCNTVAEAYERAADADLCLAAPDMLAALELAREAVADLKTYKAICAAIDKAEGRAPGSLQVITRGRTHAA